ncbi:MAG: organic solvent tolerance protein OstA [Bacteroidales bacterium]|nr:organic solvent tolerance protein OstA [Bacteroidales bacterium]
MNTHKIISKIFRKIILIVLINFLTFFIYAQQTTKITLVKANDLKYDKRLGENIQRLIGNVILKHDTTYLYCDSAYWNEITNSFDGFGNVHIKVSDTLDIYGDILNYNGNTKIAELHKNVKLIDKRAILTTDILIYDRKTRIAHYFTGGKIVDDENVLTSKIGYYFTDRKEAFFKDSVVLVNPKYIMNSDTLMYNTVNETAFFYGPSTIVSEENYIYCENGWYNTQTDKSQFKKNAYLINNEQTLRGDSLYYDRVRGYGEAYDNVSIIDTVQDMIITGNYGEFLRKKGYAFVTDSALAILTDKNDSLFLHADTLIINFDSTQTAKNLFAYYKAKFFRRNIQGMCDSLVYKLQDSTINLYNEPVLWSNENQLTADSIKIIISNNEIDSMAMFNSSFIISKDDTASFNQVKGRNMIGYFKNNELSKIQVTGNCETIYFVREEDGNIIGINKALSANMMIFLLNNDIQTITYIDKPNAVLYPEKDLTQEELFIRGFKWIEDKRPLNKSDIFKR